MRYCDGSQRERSIGPWNSHAIELGDAVTGMLSVVTFDRANNDKTEIFMKRAVRTPYK
jgi:hypothetical protein